MLKVLDDFREKARVLPDLPFVTEGEVEELFGPGVGQALALLDRINREQGICSSCGGRCCREMGCELYREELGQCPLHDFRPLLCRFHYCPRFGEKHKALIQELRDLCFEALADLPADSHTYPALELNLLLYGARRQPGEPLPELIGQMREVIEASRGDDLTEVQESLRSLIEAYLQPREPTGQRC